MRTENIIETVQATGGQLALVNGELMGKHLEPATREIVRKHKAKIIELLSRRKPQPYIKKNGELVIPFDCDAKYKWWAGGQSVRETLTELNASPEVLCKYIDTVKDC